MSKTKKRIIFAVVVLALLTAAISFGIASLASEEPTAEIKYHNLSYKSNVSIKYAVEVTGLSEDANIADVVGVAVRKGDPASDTVYEAKYEGQSTVYGKEYAIFDFSSLSATEMALDVYATPYVKTSNTETVMGKMHKNSILDYSYKILGRIEGGVEISDDVKNLISYMLVYGAKVQIYSESNTDRLANADYYQIKAVNGTLPDGFNSGLYQVGDTVTLTAKETEAGYIFKGWKNSAGAFVGTNSTLTVTVGEANETYTAVFEVDTSIKYVLDGGTLPSGSWSNYVYGSAFTLPEPTKDGYTFLGWYTSSSFAESTKISAIPANAMGGYTLYAKWKINKVEYNITYVLNGGTLPSGAPSKYEAGTSVTLPLPTKTNYVFVSWYTTADLNETTRISEITAGTTGNITLYAGWRVDRSSEAAYYEGRVEAQREELKNLQGYWNERITTGTSTNPLVNLFSDYTTDMFAEVGEIQWHSAEYIYDHTQNTVSAPALNDEHPRLLLTNDTLPLIRQKFKEDDYSNTNFTYYLEHIQQAWINDEFVLDELTGDETENESNGMLQSIQALALAYLIYEDEYYGYQAILYMKNYIRSLDIIRIPNSSSGGDANVETGTVGKNDMCRNYGYTMYTAALVYDWCYDLLTETDKIQLIAGVENCLCRDPYGVKAFYSKMEVGFPPARQSPIAGHGNEYQIFRDYLAFSVAIYDEIPSWYEYIGGRIYNDFLPIREYYFQSDMTFQGTGYAGTRNIPSLYAAWILKVAAGENPFGEGLKDAIWGLFNYEVAPGYTFTDGDANAHVDLYPQYDNRIHAYMVAYLYGDEDMLAMAEYLIDTYYTDTGLPKDGPFTGQGHVISYTDYMVLRGLCDLEASDNRYEKMELIKYNGSPLGQYTIREAWGDENSAAAFMKIKERSTAGHEHMDSGTFEIYYKGMLTSDGGCYNNDGHVYTKYYHDATISHNGLIIYNSWLKNSVDDGYYSGGQIRHTESNNLAIWNSNSNTYTGTVTGRQHGYSDTAETTPLYAYIAGDITSAYHTSSVEYVGRRMLTVYTGNEDFPMAFFVYDDVESDSASYEKRFLLQITSSDAPTISGNTITTENGDGRLVLTSLSDNVAFRECGGRVYDADGNYDRINSKNYLVNGQQMVPLQNPNPEKVDDGHWGRIEIYSTANAKKATFMNVLYVTDAGQTKAAPSVSKVTGSNVSGGTFGNIAAVFATSRTEVSTSLTFTVSGSGEMSYYVSGVAAGNWSITVGGVSYGTATATEEGGLLTFTAPAGNVTITPAN